MMRQKNLELEKAKAKAKELWGDKAFAVVCGNECCLVGEHDEDFQHVYGAGATWELAFFDAWLRLN